MADISKKSPEVDKALDSFSRNTFGRARSTSIESDVCVSCGKPAKEFRDELSKKEYSISGMCQVCQDRIFDPTIEEIY